MPRIPTEHNVYQYKDYKVSAEFAWLSEYIFDRKLKDSSKIKPIWNRKYLDKLGWRPTDFDVEPPLLSGRAAGKFHPISLVHHSFHYVLTDRYKLPLQNTPKLTLLGESLSSVSEFYFAAQFYGLRKKRHPMMPDYFQKCQSIWDIQSHELEHYLLEASKNPFSYYKKISLEMFTFLTLALDWLTLTYPTAADRKTLKKKLDQLEYRVFFEYFDIETFLTYTLGFCSKSSSREDLKASRDLIRILKDSKSMMDFLNKVSKPFDTGKALRSANQPAGRRLRTI